MLECGKELGNILKHEDKTFFKHDMDYISDV